MSNVSSNCYYHFRCVWQGVPKLPKIKEQKFFTMSLQNLKVDAFVFQENQGILQQIKLCP